MKLGRIIKLLLVLLLFFCNSCNIKSKNTKSTSLHFDGIDDQLIVPNYKQLQINEGTIEAWIKITNKNDFEWHAVAAKEKAYELTLFHYKLTGYDWKFEKKQVVGDTIPLNTWNHIALVFKDGAEKGSQLYINGKPQGDPFEINIVTQGTELFIGGNSYNPQYFNGCIDEFRVWNTIRTKEEIFNFYNKEIDPLSYGLVLYYKFNDAIAAGDNTKKTLVKDETLNNNDGNLNQFSLTGNESNFINDSPLEPKSYDGIKFFVYKNWLIITSIFSVLIFAIIYSKIRSNFLEKENRKLDLLVTQKTNLLNKSLTQKEFLIQEIHHRVKNNLQFIISLIEFEITKTNVDGKQNIPLQNISRRLTAIVLVHEMLYTKENIEKISAKSYITELVETLKDFTQLDKTKIEFKLEISDEELSVTKSTALGIIVSELVINSIKHAFNNITSPTIFIQLTSNDNENQFCFQDNGIGMPSETLNKNEGGIGKKLIDVFCRQLQGNYSFTNNNGLVFQLSFPKL